MDKKTLQNPVLTFVEIISAIFVVIPVKILRYLEYLNFEYYKMNSESTRTK